jgi:ATP/maltotriose-dependent transcriptional regulator MalT
VTLGLQGQGRALIRQGEIERGVVLLDEAMVAVTSDEVSAAVAGNVYCSVIEACSDIFDLRRAQEWTAALDRWCSTQPDQVPFRGHCMLRRSEILQIHGAWTEAMDEADRARERFSESTQKRAAGAAFFRLGDLHRLRGEFEEAEQAYRDANHLGASPQPGIAQLRLIQGQIDAARMAIRHLLAEAGEINQRARALDACVEIMLAAGVVNDARAAADELEQIAAGVKAPLLQAISERSTGAVRLAEGDVDGALAILRKSLNAFQELVVPYEEARVQFLIAKACQKLDDCDTAEMELDAARRIFGQLGAVPDLARVEAFMKDSKSGGSDLLTQREVEVLKLVAAGMTNREIASKLFISEKTVARHLSNIFVKLDLSSRAAATAYAYKNELV